MFLNLSVYSPLINHKPLLVFSQTSVSLLSLPHSSKFCLSVRVFRLFLSAFSNLEARDHLKSDINSVPNKHAFYGFD
jgi:hypothetical protein